MPAMTDEAGTTGFWSYSQEDDRSDKGRILQLASDLKDEFNLIAGHPLRIFVDREAVEWGEEWRSQIDSSLTEATFLIAIITPRFFKRQECRREILEFHGQAKSSGLERLLCPILYIDVENLTPGNDDEVMSIVARTQGADWRELRLKSADSPEYRAAVHKLAQRILKLEEEVTSALIIQEAQLPADEPGVSETVDAIEKLLPAWQESVLGDQVNATQLNATFQQHADRIFKLRARGAPRNAILATEIRLGPDLLPLGEKRLHNAKVYLSRSAELDPLVLRLIRQVREYPSGIDLAADIVFAINMAIDNIDGGLTIKVDLDYVGSLAGLSQTIRSARNVVEESHALVRQGNDIIARWWNGGIGLLADGPGYIPLERDQHGWWHQRPAISSIERGAPG
jgi:hypothetical protein